jgi:transposase
MNSDTGLAHELLQCNPHTTSPETLALLLKRWATQAQCDAEQIKKDAVQIKKDAEQIARQRTEIHCKETKIAALTLELAHHKRLRFAAKTESLSVGQRDLFNECCETDLVAMEAELTQLTPATTRPKTKPTGRKTLPAELPRIEHRHEPESCSCGSCGADLVKIGEDITEQLDVEPARFFVQRHIRPQYACRHCETVTAAAIPAAVIDGGLATPGLHAWVVIQKYLDHLPLYRIEQISTRHGVTIARSTLADWIGRIGVALQPLADRLAELLKARDVLHADETPVPQLDPGKGKTKRAYLWAYRSNDLDTGPPIVVFEFQPNRCGHHARTFLTGWQGHLMVDDYGGYKKLFGQGITELACLAHARRKFFDLFAANQHPVAAQALAKISELYQIETQAKTLTCEERLRWRSQHAQPRLDALHCWLVHTRRQTANGGALAKAIDYSLKRWPALVRYAASGNLPIDNNPIENAIRPIALGKKNWLFAGSERAGMRAASIQTLMATAKANDIEPFVWLKETLEKLPTCPNSQIDDLLPLRR